MTAFEFERCDRCPWCGSAHGEPWGRELRGFTARRCLACDLVYLNRRLTRDAQAAYYDGYLSAVHQEDPQLLAARARMYELEYELVAPHLAPGRVLDVGCSGGAFLEVFRAHGFEGFGVEAGLEAARKAAESFEVWRGELPDLDVPGEFDLVVFRGVIEHVHDPHAYLEAAWSRVAPGGLLYITSTPNRDALCTDLFRERWNQHEPEGHLFHLSVRHLDPFFSERGGRKLLERYLYEETPYAQPEQDLATVHRALERRRTGQPIEFASPPFWGNMLSVVYRKG